jgi:hypothetical protein
MEEISEESISDSSSEDETTKLWNLLPTTRFPVRFPSNHSIDSSSSDDDDIPQFSAPQNQRIGPFTLELNQINPINPTEFSCTLDSAQVLSDSSASADDSRYLGLVSESETSDSESVVTPHVQQIPNPPDLSTQELLNTSFNSIESDSDTLEDCQPSHPLNQLLQVTPSNQPKVASFVEDRGNHYRPTATISSNETLYNWRRCLWPPLAPFYRILLRCKCIAMNENNPLMDKKRKRSDSLQSLDHPSLPLTSDEILSSQYFGLEWTDFWDPQCLEHIPLTFEK